MGSRLTPSERAVLLRAARDGLEAAVAGRLPCRDPAEAEGRLAEPGACFVTLYEGDQLRGCIGGLEARQPLAEAVRAMTEASALRDPRFRPVTPDELPRIAISLSVLSPLEPLGDPSALRVGEHGLVVGRGWQRGVLLPQVPVEHGWDRETFLAQTCRKAGLPADVWQDPDTVLEVFSAEVFGEPPARS